MATETLHNDDELERARRAARALAGCHHPVPAPVAEAQHRVELHLRRMQRSGFDPDVFEALLDSWRVVSKWLNEHDAAPARPTFPAAAGPSPTRR